MRPESIRRFEWFFWIGAVAPVIAILTDYQFLKQQALAGGHSQLGPITGVLFSVAVDLALWLAIVRKASNVGKWIMVIMTGLSVLLLPREFRQFVAISHTYTILMLASLAAWTVACGLLFRRDAREWLASRGKNMPVDPGVFS